MENSITVKSITYTSEEGVETFYHAFYKENGKVQAFSVMTELKGK